MKKIILNTALTLTLCTLPFISNADPFTQLVKSVTTTTTGVCGDPDQQPKDQFCQCFDQQIVEGCKKYLPVQLCTVPQVKNRIGAIGIPATCSKYPPIGVGYDECVKDITYFLPNC